jgi:hypothetical protein
MKNNNFHITIPVSGLIRRESYSYEIVGLGGNWPAFVSPTGGSFVSNSKSIDINASISFLPTTGLTQNLNVLPYDLLSCGYNNNEIFTNVAVKVTSLSDNSEIFSPTTLVKCSGCLPSIDINMSGCGSTSCGQYSLTSGNIFDFTSSISGLEPNTKYQYAIKSVGANWPTIMITPTGGSFVPNDNTYELKHKLVFCPYSGNLCGSSNVLQYDLAQCFNKNNLYANIELSLAPEYCFSEKTFSNTILLNCKNCLPKITSSLPSKLSLSSSNKVSITGSFSGLIPNTLYNYSFTALDSNWPSLLKPISGSFVSSSTSETITSALMFCSPSGNCPSGTADLLPYSLDTLAEKDFYQKKLYANLALNLTSECGDNVTSKQLVVECNNCLPCVTYANAIFSGSPTISLDDVCCSGQKLLSVNVTNAIPGDKYIYDFNHTSGVGVNSIAFNPISGEMYFGSGGVGTINTIASIDLVNYAQTLINFELTHSLSNTKVFDTIGLVCNTGSCF